MVKKLLVLLSVLISLSPIVSFKSKDIYLVNNDDDWTIEWNGLIVEDII